MRRPHVFISSRLTLSAVRKGIRKILEETGFSVEIYEADSTPSFEPATYIHDIQLADFVIFVFDDTYGTPRPSTGKSGIHEEWDVVRRNRIPNHVYLQRKSNAAIEEQQAKFIKEELQQREISYFYYSGERDLMAQVRKSIAKMTLDIGRSPEFRSHLSTRSLAGEVSKRDHDTYYQWDRAIKLAAEIENQQSCLSTAWSIVSDSVMPFSPSRLGPFIDEGTQMVFGEFLVAIENLCHFESEHVVGYSGALATMPFPEEPQLLQRLRVVPPTPLNFYETRAGLRTKALDSWKKLGEHISVRYSKFADI
jgi:uncharacterized protein (DUF2164 family)